MDADVRRSCRPTSTAGCAGAALRDDRRRARRATTASGCSPIVATAGTTNAGVVDDLAGVADVCAELGRVDARRRRLRRRRRWPRRACATASPASSTPTASSSIRTSGCSPRSTAARCVYRDPDIGRARPHPARRVPRRAARRHDDGDGHEWNPSDYAHHLSRRARGLPFWFSLATHGTDAYPDAIETDARRHPRGRRADRDAAAPRADHGARAVRSLLFRRIGWTRGRLPGVERPPCSTTGTSFVTPTSWNGEIVLRLCIVNPLTSVDDLARSSSTRWPEADRGRSPDPQRPAAWRRSTATAASWPAAGWPSTAG